MSMVTPRELAAQVYGMSDNWAKSPGTRRVRKVARELWGLSGGRWYFTPDQVETIKKRL